MSKTQHVAKGNQNDESRSAAATQKSLLAPVKIESSVMAKLYNKGATLVQLAGKTHLAVPVIRESLVASGVAIRPKGGFRGNSQKRAEDMSALYTEGKTLQEVGDKYGLTRERVRQILRQLGTESLGRRDKEEAELTAKEKKIALLYDKGTSPMEICKRRGISYTELHNILKRAGITLKPKGFFNRRLGYEKIRDGVIRDYKEGEITRVIANRYGLCGPTEIYKFIKREGVESRMTVAWRKQQPSWSQPCPVCIAEAGEFCVSVKDGRELAKVHDGRKVK